MSVNLMELAKQSLGKPVTSQIGGILGESPEKTEAAISSALPALIGGLMKKASSPSGAGEIMQAIENQDDSILDRTGELLEGDGSTSLLNVGSETLKMLFGDRLASVLDLLTKSTGMGSKSLTSLLSLLAPLVMSLLKRQSASGGLDAAGLTQMLADQKESIGNALPDGFGNALGLSSLASSAAEVAGAGHNVAGGFREATNSAAAGSGSLLGKLLPLIALVALALIALQVFRGRNDEQSPAGGDEASSAEIDEAQPSDELTLSGPLTQGSTEESAD